MSLVYLLIRVKLLSRRRHARHGAKILFHLFIFQDSYFQNETKHFTDPFSQSELVNNDNYYYYYYYFMAQQPLVVQGLLTIEASRSHSDTPHSVGLLCTSDQPVAETSTWQHSQETDVHALGGIRTRNSSKRAAVDPRFTPRHNWEWLIIIIIIIIIDSYTWNITHTCNTEKYCSVKLEAWALGIIADSREVPRKKRPVTRDIRIYNNNN